MKKKYVEELYRYYNRHQNEPYGEWGEVDSIDKIFKNYLKKLKNINGYYTDEMFTNLMEMIDNDPELFKSIVTTSGYVFSPLQISYIIVNYSVHKIINILQIENRYYEYIWYSHQR